MKSLSLFLIALATSVLVASSAGNHPEFKASVDYEFFEAVKMNILQPSIKQFVLNKVINTTINSQGSGWIYSYDVTFSDPIVTGLDMDWTNTHILAPGANNGSILQIRGMTVTAAVNASIRAQRFIHTEGKCTVVIKNINADVALGFSPNPTGDNIYVSIPSAKFDYDKLDITFDTTVGSIFTWLISFFANHLVYGTVTSSVTNMLTNDMSNTLKTMTMNGVQIPYNDFNITLTIPEQPVVNVSPTKNYTNIGFQLNILNTKTGETAPAFFDEVIADYRATGEQVQFMIASNMLNQVGWAVQQLGMISANISNKNLPADAPISLNTTALKILIPELASKYGLGKGIYVALKQANEAPAFYTRDARLIGMLSTVVEFWVDTDGSRYPDEGLANCTTCSQAVAFNNSLVLELNVFKIDPAHIGVTVLNVDMVELHILNGEGFDGKALRSSLNNLLAGLIPTINAKLKTGIQFPLVGLFGLKGVSVNVNKNYLSLELSLKRSKSA